MLILPPTLKARAHMELESKCSHDPNRSYSVGDPIAVIDSNGQLAGYLCIKMVPSNENIPYTNLEYWARMQEAPPPLNYMVGAAAILFDPVGKVLVGERVDYASNPIEALFGGKPEYYETLAEGLSREVREEVGVHVGAKRFTQIAIVEASPGRGLKCITAYYCAALDWEEVNQVQNLEPHKCFGIHWRTVDEITQRGLWQDAAQYVRRAFGSLFCMRRIEDTNGRRITDTHTK